MSEFVRGAAVVIVCALMTAVAGGSWFSLRCAMDARCARGLLGMAQPLELSRVVSCCGWSKGYYFMRSF